MSNSINTLNYLSITNGLATLVDGTTVDLLEIQRLLVQAFQEHGDNQLGQAAMDLAKITGKTFDHELNVIDYTS